MSILEDITTLNRIITELREDNSRLHRENVTLRRDLYWMKTQLAEIKRIVEGVLKAEKEE